MQRFRTILKKSKQTIKSLSFLTVLFFGFAKVFIGFVELPHMTKNSTVIPYLMISLIFGLAAIGCKIYKHRLLIIRTILPTQKQSFLLWIIAIILMIFSWALADNLAWNIVEKILLILCSIASIFMITLLHYPKFISKFQFISFELIFVIQILTIALKTVGFIKDHSGSPDKDIVLLNLTTQIALVIILMDYVQKSYSQHKQQQVQQDMSRLQNQMIFVNRNRKSSKTKTTQAN